MYAATSYIQLLVPTPNPADPDSLGGTYIALCLNPLASPQTLFAGSGASAFLSVD
jgi:hypothetical protein